ncbi:MAG TPA: hypothetical protein VFX03_00695 [Thermomicrobiales bacterium]|nr:hypothetical protein [Thermomicrobiales bacterium]
MIGGVEAGGEVEAGAAAETVGVAAITGFPRGANACKPSKYETPPVDAASPNGRAAAELGARGQRHLAWRAHSMSLERTRAVSQDGFDIGDYRIKLHNSTICTGQKIGDYLTWRSFLKIVAPVVLRLKRRGGWWPRRGERMGRDGWWSRFA